MGQRPQFFRYPGCSTGSRKLNLRGKVQRQTFPLRLGIPHPTRDSHFPTARTTTVPRLHFKWCDDLPYGYILKWLDAVLTAGFSAAPISPKTVWYDASHSPMINARSDVVGSLLRPPELLAAQKQFAEGPITAAEFKKIEDKAVDQAIALQEEAGLEVVTDGEMRRQSFQSQMTAAVEGFGEHSLDAFLWGDWRGDPELGSWNLPRPSNLGVVGKARRHLSAEEFTYLRARTRRITKITLPSATLNRQLEARLGWGRCLKSKKALEEKVQP